MKVGLNLLLLLFLFSCNAQEKPQVFINEKSDTMNYNELTPQEERVLVHKATDRPFTGEYYNKKDRGLYICRRCNNPLYRSDDKFDSHCGWPSFDDEIEGAVKRVPDADGYRTEIICMNCGGHLGHVFLGEGFTKKETRHCVNTSSLRFIPKNEAEHLPAVIK
jgi:methionine-R-sulfoxide reductase